MSEADYHRSWCSSSSSALRQVLSRSFCEVRYVLMREVNMRSEVSLIFGLEGYRGSEAGSQLRVECAMMIDASFYESNDDACRRILHREVV